MSTIKGEIIIRRICVITERRADYSRMKPILEELRDDPDLDYSLIVTGQHLLPELGNTVEVIEADGFKIDVRIKNHSENESDTGADMCRAMGKALIGIADALEEIEPDMVLVGFDLGANLAAAIAGAHMNIPVAHIQGGEVTGTIDESLRHAISKFAHIHFPANQDAAERLIKLGEDPKYVFNVGCPSLDVILNAQLLSEKDIVEEFGIDPAEPFGIIIQHPVTTEVDKSQDQIVETLSAVRELELQTIMIYPNIDAGGRKIIEIIESSNIKVVKNLPFEKFLSLLKISSILIGNSSCGIREASSFNIPVVNIGTRQQGRLRPDNVLDVGYDRDQIKEAIEKALHDKEFAQIVKVCENPYGDGKSAKRIVKIMKEIEITPEMLQKRILY
jgi:UDP-N-acetylglucosamine 2-epimerase (non-hydrolysing)/GDP/UDP-N,N'-diacetylbacillosamine 2-epimerase (hydrolysing)